VSRIYQLKNTEVSAQGKATVSSRGQAPTFVGANYLRRELFAVILQ